jgi:hypothetical protein
MPERTTIIVASHIIALISGFFGGGLAIHLVIRPMAVLRAGTLRITGIQAWFRDSQLRSALLLYGLGIAVAVPLLAFHVVGSTDGLLFTLLAILALDCILDPVRKQLKVTPGAVAGSSAVIVLRALVALFIPSVLVFACVGRDTNWLAVGASIAVALCFVPFLSNERIGELRRASLDVAGRQGDSAPHDQV